jgi:hypothetical protein
MEFQITIEFGNQEITVKHSDIPTPYLLSYTAEGSAKQATFKTFPDNNLENMNIQGTVAGDQLAGIIEASEGMGDMRGDMKGTIAGKRCEFTADPELMLQQAQTFEAQRKPKDAIVIYARIIDHHRARLEYSLPALERLVECEKLMKGDATQERMVQDLLEKYLRTPPRPGEALDPALAKKDLLWKPWRANSLADSEQLLHFVVERSRRVKFGQEGKATERVSLDLIAPAPEGITFEFERLSPGEKGEGTFIELVDAAGTTYAIDTSRINLYQRRGSVYLLMETEGLPVGVRELKEVRGTLRVFQVTKYDDIKVPFQVDSTWQTQEYDGRVAACSSEGKNIQLTLAIAAKNPTGGTGAGSGAESNPAGITTSPLWLMAGEEKLYPIRIKTSSTGKVGTVSMIFSSDRKPDTVVCRVITERDKHDIPFSLTNVALP